ncbi:hypothetical protein TYRP_011522 [Tyrophagus putrescentiae]|nr:hypothetical protein TYRP_011522 [Tyrophagus putrescentiae]
MYSGQLMVSRAEAPVQSLQVGPAKGAKDVQVNPAHLVARLIGHAEEAVLLDVEEEAEANGGDLAVELLHHRQLISRREDAEGLDALAEAAVLLHVVAGRIEAVNQRGRSAVVDDRQLGFIVKHLHGHAYLLQALGFVNVEIKVWLDCGHFRMMAFRDSSRTSVNVKKGKPSDHQ